MYGSRIRQLRQERGWSQQELGAKLNCAQKTVSRYELEQVEPAVSDIVKLCKLFEVSADDLLGLEDETGLKIR